MNIKSNIPIRKKPGYVFLDDDNNLSVQCAQDYIIIEKIQIEGKNILDSKNFVNGRPDFIGSILL